MYHTDLWPEFKELLLPLSNNIKLYIGLCNTSPSLNDFDDFDHQLSFHDNYGADISSFLYQIRDVKEDLFIKLHSKKSLWGFKYHINWRQMMLNDLISSLDILKSNIKILLSNESNSVLCNKILLMDNREFHNSSKIHELCSLLNIDYSRVKNSKFVAGNMFMGKTSIYKKYLEPHIETIDKLLYNEKGKVDDTFKGTYSHSMERIFGYIISYNNLKFCYPKHKIIKVINTEAPNKKYFNLIKMYNNYCYILEDPNLYGYISNMSEKSCVITWYHLDEKSSITYNLINKNTICKR